jgi:hypothetical protein
MSPHLPEACQVALKEWSGVCAGLKAGHQGLLLRKGGIAEEAGWFRPEHEAFWLYPTFVHQEEQGLRTAGAASRPTEADRVVLDALALVTDVVWVDREAVLDDLEPWHILTRETVHQRFRYRKPGLWVLSVRVYAGGEPHRIPVTAEHAGCKSWVALDAPLPTRGLRPVLADEAYRERVEALRRVTGRRDQGR